MTSEGELLHMQKQVLDSEVGSMLHEAFDEAQHLDSFTSCTFVKTVLNGRVFRWYC